VIDPTIGRLQPWEHWHQDVVPKRAIRTREYVFSQSNLNMFNFDEHFSFFLLSELMIQMIVYKP